MSQKTFGFEKSDNELISEYKTQSLMLPKVNSVIFTENGINRQYDLKNQLICGDNFERIKTIPDDSIDLIYCDPFFLSQQDYEKIDKKTNESRSFSDKIIETKIENIKIDNDSNISNKGSVVKYINNNTPLYHEMYRVLKLTGSFYLHCDWHASHYIKIALDSIFGYDNFRNEIIWCYEGGGVAMHQFKRKHDVILFYTKSDSYTFNPQIIERINPKNYKKGVPIKNIGKVINDWWSDIPSRGTATMSKEWLDVPTQKPEKLLERIIKASSNENDMVLDPFCGSGTTLAVAKKLNRKYIGIDRDPVHIRITAKRINFTLSEISGVFSTLIEIKSYGWKEFQQWVCNKMIAKNIFPNTKDGGIDGIVLSNFDTMGFAGSLIQAKQSDGVGQGVVKEFITTLNDAKIKIGFIVAYSFTSGAIEQVEKYKLDGKLKIYLVKVDDLYKTNYYNYKLLK